MPAPQVAQTFPSAKNAQLECLRHVNGKIELIYPLACVNSEAKE